MSLIVFKKQIQSEKIKPGSIPSNGDRLNVPSGWTPTASVWLRVPHSIWAFALFPISPPTIVGLLACVSFHIPVLSFFLHFLYYPVLSVLSLTKSCWACPLQVPPPAYFLLHPYTFSYHVLPFLLYFLIPYFPSISYFPCLSRISSPKILLSMPAPGPSSIVFPFLSLCPFLPYFPVYCGFYLALLILPLLCL